MGLAIFLAIASAACAGCSRSRAGWERVSVSESRLAPEKDDGGALSVVDREGHPTVVYHVTLADAPVGSTLPLACSWIDPQGRVAFRNSWETHRITKDRWPTHCRSTFGATSTPGAWTVTMSLLDRTLVTSRFEVK
jgi:hypothetical protein